MHVLTKIFIVLVSLLAVLLVPLVVVYAYNENSYQAKYSSAQTSAAGARADLAAAKAGFGAAESQKEWQIKELAGINIELRKQVDREETEIRRLERRLMEAEAGRSELDAKLSTLASAVDAGQRLTESLIEELRGLRKDALDSERRLVQVDEALRDAQAQLDVAIEARRAVQEELQRIKDEHGVALDKLAVYFERFGSVDEVVVRRGEEGVEPDRDLSATIISVRRNSDQVLAEIDAGSRDGVEVGWLMTIGHGGDFIGRLRIVSVDINRATGVVELEQNPVEVGHLVIARAGR